MKPFPLATDRLLLREFRAEDEEAIHAYASDPEVTRHTSWGPNTPAITHNVLSSWLSAQEMWPRNSIPLAIESRSEGVLMGGTGFTPVDPDRQTGTFGYVLHKAYWGRGFATEAALALIRFGFEILDLHRIVAECFIENTASRRVLEKLGMRCEGHFLKSVRKAGEWRDTYLYAMLRGEWLNRHENAIHTYGASPE